MFIFVAKWPSAALGAVLSMYGLDQWSAAKSAFFSEHHAVTNLLMGAMVLVALVRGFLSNPEPRRWRYPLTGWLTLMLFGYAALSIMWSQFPHETERVFRTHIPYLITIVLLLPLTVNFLKNVQHGFFVFLIVAILLVPLLLFTTHWHGRTVETVYGLGQNPLETGSLGARVFLLLLLMNFRGSGRLFQLLRWIVGGFAVLLVVHSGSRGQFIGMFVLAIALLPFSRRFTTLKGTFSTIIGLFAAVALMGVLVVHYGDPTRWNLSFQHVQNVYVDSRGEMVGRVLTYWAHSNPVYWVFGIGNSACYSPSVNGGYPHFVPAEVLAEEGLIGLTLLLSILWFVGRAVVRIYRVCKPFDDARGVAVALTALFLFDLILSLKEGSLLGSPNLFAWIVIVGQVDLSLRRYVANPAPALQMAAVTA